MPPRPPAIAPAKRLAALRIVDPPAWREAVRAALVGAGNVPAAAELLGVSVRALYGWLRAEPSLRRGVEIRGPGRPWPDATGQ